MDALSGSMPSGSAVSVVDFKRAPTSTTTSSAGAAVLGAVAASSAPALATTRVVVLPSQPNPSADSADEDKNAAYKRFNVDENIIKFGPIDKVINAFNRIMGELARIRVTVENHISLLNIGQNINLDYADFEEANLRDQSQVRLLTPIVNKTSQQLFARSEPLAVLHGEKEGVIKACQQRWKNLKTKCGIEDMLERAKATLQELAGPPQVVKGSSVMATLSYYLSYVPYASSVPIISSMLPPKPVKVIERLGLELPENRANMTLDILLEPLIGLRYEIFCREPLLDREQALARYKIDKDRFDRSIDQLIKEQPSAGNLGKEGEKDKLADYQTASLASKWEVFEKYREEIAEDLEARKTKFAFTDAELQASLPLEGAQVGAQTSPVFVVSLLEQSDNALLTKISALVEQMKTDKRYLVEGAREEFYKFYQKGIQALESRIAKSKTARDFEISLMQKSAQEQRDMIDLLSKLKVNLKDELQKTKDALNTREELLAGMKAADVTKLPQLSASTESLVAHFITDSKEDDGITAAD